MSRLFARRRLLAVGLSLALAIPILGSTSATASDRGFEMLRLRDSGPRVLLAQRVLDVDPRTGFYNKRTKQAVKRFQDNRNYEVTGLVNERTWHALERRWDAIQDARRRINTKYHRIMKIAKNQKGDPYVYGAAGPGAFDCSGLTMYVYRQAAGVSMRHTATGQFRKGDRITRKQARPGDLVFMHSGGNIYHAGIYAGKGRILHASRPGTNVKVDPIWTSSTYFVRILPNR
jgi:cell wall-associated NlpC family hydrolase